MLGLDSDRVFYPCVLIAVAYCYAAFADVDGRSEVMLLEVALSNVLIGVSVVGFKRSLGLVAMAMAFAGYGVMDFFHHQLVHNAGVPAAWQGFCPAFDVTAPFALGFNLWRRTHVADYPTSTSNDCVMRQQGCRSKHRQL